MFKWFKKNEKIVVIEVDDEGYFAVKIKYRNGKFRIVKSFYDIGYAERLVKDIKKSKHFNWDGE